MRKTMFLSLLTIDFALGARAESMLSLPGQGPERLAFWNETAV